MKTLTTTSKLCSTLIDTTARSKINNHNLSSDIRIFFNFLKQFSLKYSGNEFRKLLKCFSKTELKPLRHLAPNSKHGNFQKDGLVS